MLQPQLWSEDIVFFGQNWLLGPAALWDSYAGYLHTLPRLIALFASLFSPAFSPLIYLLATLASLLAIALCIHSRLIRLPAAWALLVAVTLVPHNGEVFLNITNLQWFCALLLLAAVFIDNSEPVDYRALLLYLLVALAALSSLTVLLALVLCVLRIGWALAVRRSAGFARRLASIDTPDGRLQQLYIITGICALAALLQLYCLSQNTYRAEDSLASLSLAFNDWFPAYRIMSFRILGPYVNNALGVNACTLIYSLASIAMLVFALLRKRHFQQQLCLLLFVVGLAFLLAMKFKSHLLLFTIGDMADRYFYVPRIILLWQLLLTIDRTVGRILLLGVAMALLLLSSDGWLRVSYPDTNWQQQVESLAAENAALDLVVAVNPPGWRGLFVVRELTTASEIPEMPADACRHQPFSRDHITSGRTYKAFYVANRMCDAANRKRDGLEK